MRFFIRIATYPLKSLLFVLLIYHLLFPVTILASNITMEYEIGFNGSFRLGKWTPISITFENRGQGINGNVELSCAFGSEYRGDVTGMLYTQEIDLPTNSRKKCLFTIPLKSFAHPLIIRIRDNKKVLLSDSVNLRGYFREKGLGVFVSGKSSIEGLLKLPEDVHPVTIRPLFLPESWYGYDGVNILIMTSSTLNIMNERQFRAVEGWIERGGYCIISGEINYGPLTMKRAKKFLSIDVLGLEEVTGIQSMAGFCECELESTAPFLILNTAAESSEVLLKEAEIPVITMRKRGLGKIIFMAFDYRIAPFAAWEGKAKFWEKIYKLCPDPVFADFDPPLGTLRDSLIKIISTRFPGLFFIVLFVILFLVLNTVLLRRIRIKGKFKPVNATVFILINLVFTVAAFWIFLINGPGNEISYNSISYLRKIGPGDTSLCRLIMGLYAFKDSRVDLFVHGECPPFIPVPGEGGFRSRKINQLEVRETGNGHIVSVPLKKWTHRFITMKTMIVFPLDGQASIKGDNILFVYENQTSFPITSSGLYYRGKIFRINDILPHEKKTLRFLIHDMIDRGKNGGNSVEFFLSEEDTGIYNDFHSKVRVGALKDMLNRIDSEMIRKDDIITVFGWIGSSLIPPSFLKNGITGEGTTFFEWRIPLKELFY